MSNHIFNGQMDAKNRFLYFVLIKLVFNMLGCASKCSIVIGAHGVLEPLGGVKHLLLLSTKRYNK